MAETHNRLLVDVNAEVVDIITAVQEDTNSRYLDVVLYNNGVPVNLTGHEVRIYLRKPETGQEVWNNGEITDAVKGRCQFLMTTQALAEVGYLKAQISIWKDNTEILSTQIFNILVTKSLRTTGSIESSNEYGALVVLFQNLYEAHALMTKMVESFGEAGKIATGIAADTFWKMLEAVYQVNADALKNASVSEVLDRIGTTSDTGGTATAGTAMAKLNALLGKNTSAVKSVQHGEIDLGGKGEVSVAINPVNVDKSICLDNGSHSSYNGSRFHDLGVELTLTNNSLIAKTTSINVVRTLSFSVIEFY